MTAVSLFELTIVYQYKVEGNVQPLVDYLRSELKDEVAKDFIAKILLGEIKKGDKRRARKEARNLVTVFDFRRKMANLCESERGEPPVPDAEIYASLDEDCGYEYDTAKRMIKREREKQRKRKEGHVRTRSKVVSSTTK